MFKNLSFVDVETTGLTKEDRVVSIGIVRIDDLRAVAAGDEQPRFDYLIFNPGRRSHPIARKVHGYTDEYLAQQPDFGAHAGEIFGAFDAERVVAAHNASFDRRFLRKEFEQSGYPLHRKDYFCTMLAHRQKHGSPSGLDAVVKQTGYAARGEVHGALEDAWLAVVVYCWIHGLPLPPLRTAPDQQPTNAVNRSKPAAVAQFSPVAVAAAVQEPEDLRLLKPMATLMMFIAHADGQLARTEVESISLLMHTMLAGRTALSDDQQQDLLASLCAMEPSPADVEAACASVLADAAMRKALPGWLRQVSYADGAVSADESSAIQLIAQYLRARNRLQ